MCQFTYSPTVIMQVYIKFPGVTSGTVIYVDKVNFYAKGKDSLNNPQSTVSTTHLPFTHVQPSDISCIFALTVI